MVEYFVFCAGGELKRIPVTVMEKLRERGASIPDFAGQRVKAIEVWKNAGPSGAPESVDRDFGFHLVFDSDGFLEEGAKEESRKFAWHLMADGLGGASSSVVDLSARREKRELQEKYRWEPSPAERQRVIDAALGHPRRTPNIKSIKHKRLAEPAEPTVSFEARKAFDAFSDFFWRPSHELSRLSEADLEGFKALVRKRAHEAEEDAPLWRGVMEMADRALQLRRARRTGEGEWYAVVEMIKWDERNLGEGVGEWSLKCSTRPEAVQAARRLMKENIDGLGETMTCEARVLSALEWDREKE